MTEKPPALFDFAAARRARARATALGGDRFLDRAAAEGLADRLSAVTRRFERGLWIGDRVAGEIAGFAATWTCGDFTAQEELAADGAFDLAVSLFSLQWINDLPGALAQVRRQLKPDGLFVGALLGASTLHELREGFAHAESA